MPQFLFVIDAPAPGISTEEFDAPTRWSAFEERAKTIKLPSGAKKLQSRNVWLFPAENSDAVRRALANYADEQKLSHSTYLVIGEVTKL